MHTEFRKKNHWYEVLFIELLLFLITHNACSKSIAVRYLHRHSGTCIYDSVRRP